MTKEEESAKFAEAIKCVDVALGQVYDAIPLLEEVGYTRELTVLDNMYVAKEALEGTRTRLIKAYQGAEWERPVSEPICGGSMAYGNELDRGGCTKCGKPPPILHRPGHKCGEVVKWFEGQIR